MAPNKERRPGEEAPRGDSGPHREERAEREESSAPPAGDQSTDGDEETREHSAILDLRVDEARKGQASEQRSNRATPRMA